MHRYEIRRWSNSLSCFTLFGIMLASSASHAMVYAVAQWGGSATEYNVIEEE